NHRVASAPLLPKFVSEGAAMDDELRKRATSAFALNGIDAFFGDSPVLGKVSFSRGEGRLLGLLGRNGGGKSTCMNVAVGLLPPRGGTVELFGTEVTRLSPGLIAARGLAR